VTDPARALLNRTLDREPWARARLAAHSGKTFRVVIGPASFAHAIDGSSTSASTPSAASASRSSRFWIALTGSSASSNWR